MKKAILMFAVLGVLASCGGDDKDKKGTSNSTSTEQKTETTSNDLSNNPDYQKGLAIVGKSDCMTCHLIDSKNIGPAWRDVANKYAGQDTAIKYLAKKIIEGGSGVWGTVPMAPHPTFTQEEAEAVAKYVLLLNKK